MRRYVVAALAALLIVSPAYAAWPGWLSPFADGIEALEQWTIANIERIANVFDAHGYKTVGPTSEYDYQTIQAAIDSCPSGSTTPQHGCEIRIECGDYAEDLVINGAREGVKLTSKSYMGSESSNPDANLACVRILGDHTDATADPAILVDNANFTVIEGLVVDMDDGGAPNPSHCLHMSGANGRVSGSQISIRCEDGSDSGEVGIELGDDAAGEEDVTDNNFPHVVMRNMWTCVKWNSNQAVGQPFEQLRCQNVSGPAFDQDKGTLRIENFYVGPDPTACATARILDREAGAGWTQFIGPGDIEWGCAHGATATNLMDFGNMSQMFPHVIANTRFQIQELNDAADLKCIYAEGGGLVQLTGSDFDSTTTGHECGVEFIADDAQRDLEFWAWGNMVRWNADSNGRQPLDITATESGGTIVREDQWAASSGGGHTIKDEGTPLTQRSGLNFTGAGVVCTDDAGNDETDCAITGAGFTPNADPGVDHSSFDAEVTANVTVAANAAHVAAPGHTTDTNANTICTGTDVYLDGEGNCDTITGGGGWTDGGTVLHPTTSTDDIGNDATGTNWLITDAGVATFESVSTADQTSEPGNLISLRDNDTAFTNDPTCANSGTAGELTIIDKDESAADDYVVCDGTTEIQRLFHSYMAAETGGDAASTSLSVSDQFFLMNLSLTEVADRRAEFTTSANETCYTGTPTISVMVSMPVSFERDTGSGTDTITLAFGKDTTGAIGNTDEIGEEFTRTISTNAVIGMGTVQTATTLATNDCIGLLGSTNGATDGVTIGAGTLTITEH